MCSVAVKERISYRSQSLCASGFGKPCDEGAAAVENDLFDRTGSGMGHKNHVWSDLGPPCAGSHGSAYADSVGVPAFKLAEAVPGLGAGAGAAARMVLGSGVLIKIPWEPQV